MHKLLGMLLVYLVIPGITLAIGSVAIASDVLADTEIQVKNTTNPLAQVTSVSQLSDVQPTDWAFQALQSLVERYGCIAGYPDSTYRGNRALTRYEFAAGVNACLDRINELIATATADTVRREDLNTLQRLQAEFAAEIATLRGRVDTLEATTAELEANQFSTTTKLTGETIFAISDVFGEDVDENTVFQGRVRLNFDTSFTGKDRLRTRLQAGNFNRFAYLGGGEGPDITNEGRLSFATNTSNDVTISDLVYNFPVGNTATLALFAFGADQDDFITVLNPFLFSSGTGTISLFGLENPIYFLGGQNAGLLLQYQITDSLKLDLSYLAGNPENPAPGTGLFDGRYSALARLEIDLGQLDISLAYLNTYDRGVITGTGSLRSQVDVGRPVVANTYGFQLSYAFSPTTTISGWIGNSNARVIGLGDADVWNYAVTLAFNDILKEGDLLAFVVGQEPKLTGTSGFTVLGRRSDPNTGYHLEALYRYRITDTIFITPGIVWLTAPGHDNSNNDIVVGTVRTTFQF